MGAAVPGAREAQSIMQHNNILCYVNPAMKKPFEPPAELQTNLAIGAPPAAGLARLPRLAAGPGAENRFGQSVIEAFAAELGNDNTRAAYAVALRRFFAWCADSQIEDALRIMPHTVEAYVEELGRRVTPATQRQHVAALRQLFGWLVAGKRLKYDPTTSLRVPARKAPTAAPSLAGAEAERLIGSIDGGTIIGLRDRALIGLLVYGCARIGAVLAMRVEDYFWVGKRRWLRLHEKGGRRHELPAHPKLAAYLDAYLAGLDGAAEGASLLFSSLRGRSATPGGRALSRVDAYRMIRRRAVAAGIRARIGCHSFRATGIAAYFAGGGTLAGARAIAAHASARSIVVYDRSKPDINQEEIERIAL